MLEKLFEDLYDVLKTSCALSNSKLLCLSGGLDSSIISHFLKQQKPQGVVVITEDFISTDLTYSQMISKDLNIHLSIFYVTTTAILEAIEETIKILKNFNDIEIRNNVVMFLAIKWAKDHGEKSIITGDGADELFAGYNFLLNKSQSELESEIKRLCSIMHFPTHKIGNYLKVSVESPFLDPNVVEFAKKIPVHMKINDYNGTKYGKWILRKTFEDHLPQKIVWREKSPMQDGSGTVGLTNLFNSVIDEKKFVEEKLTIEKEDNVIIRNRESMYYYKIFKKLFGSPLDLNAEFQCPYCKHNTMKSKFCRMCGAFPI